MAARTSVIVITLNRPDYVRKCLDALRSQEPPPDQIIVVDSSKDDLTKQMTANFPGVLYLRNDKGFGRMTTSRNIALKHSTGEIIAFVDDDAFAHAGWLSGLVAAYTGPEIGAVGGRALNDVPGEEAQGVDRIGKLTKYGNLESNFAADPGKIRIVDHIIGCNMSFRREVLARLGGFRENFPGISGVSEDTDMSMRVRKLGYTVLFAPEAVVDHVSAPQAVGQRFDTRYAYNGTRNRLVMLVSNFGLFSRYAIGYSLYSPWHALCNLKRFRRGLQPGILAAMHLGATIAGVAAGLVLGTRLMMQHHGDPVRRDPDALEIAQALDAPV
jgi:GT2 family glycosyltransferase